MSSGIKLAVMGVAGAALLYSCGPSVGAGLGALPYLWFLPNPFYRPPIAAAPCPPGQVCPPQQQATGTSSGSSSGSTGTGSSFRSGTGSTSTSTRSSSTSESSTSSSATSTTSQRGGFGSTGSSHSSSS